MGLKDKLKKYNEQHSEEQFHPIELTEGNVQAIFNKCIAKEGTPNEKCFRSLLFSSIKGYNADAERIVVFDKERVLDNKKSIQYLYGQLKNIHFQDSDLQINDAFISYLGKKWTLNKGILLEFLYLGAINDGEPLISIFDSKTDSTKLNPDNKPTLSPKDPNFPAWWEEHKSEWEEHKKEGQEPADD